MNAAERLSRALDSHEANVERASQYRRHPVYGDAAAMPVPESTTVHFRSEVRQRGGSRAIQRESFANGRCMQATVTRLKRNSGMRFGI